jgi:pimeloyl-[acyl-carrier protein] methyl ester esterase
MHRAARTLLAVSISLALVGILSHGTPALAKSPQTIVLDRFSDEIIGSGPDIILIPGLASSRDTWRGQIPALASRYRIHLIQVAGFAGESSRSNAAGAVLVPTAEAIDAYLVSKRLTPAIIIGHSLGGTMTLYLAEHHPDHIKKALLVDALPFFATVMGNSRATEESMAPIAAGIRANSTPDTPERMAQRMASMAIAQSDKDMISNWSNSSDASVIRNALADDLTLDLRPGLAAISTPLTLIYPDYAPLGSPKGAADGQYRAAYSAVPHMTFVPITDSLHFIMLDQPKQFESALQTFLAN